MKNKILVCWLLACLCSMSFAADAPRPNILVIMADDLGFSDIAPFGSEIPTPALDGLAKEGIVMTSMYATPMPHTTHAELLFGVDHHLTVDRFSVPGSTPATAASAATDPQPVSIATVLREAGYHTYMVGTWDSGNDARTNAVARGFESSHALMSMAGDYFPPDGANVPAAKEGFRYQQDGRDVAPPTQYITDFWTDRLIGYLQRDAGDGKPFFAYVGYTTPHFPLQAPDEFLSRQRGKYTAGYDAIRLARIEAQRRRGLIPRDLVPAQTSPGYKQWNELTASERAVEARRMEVYAAMVENLDWNVGRILQALRSSGRYQNTLIVFTSTNGAAQSVATHRNPAGFDNSLDNLGRKNSWIAYSERWAEVSNAPFAGWKAKGTEGSITVPTIVRLPGPARRVRINDAVARIRDLPATFMEFSNAAMPRRNHPIEPYSSRSLRALWQGDAERAYAAEEMLIDEHRDEGYVRRGEWKAVLISDTAVNAYDGADPANTEYLAALRAGDAAKAAAIRASRPSRWKLYRIASDRGETRDLATAHPTILQELVAAFERYMKIQMPRIGAEPML